MGWLTSWLESHQPVEVLVDFLLMRKSQHAADHACVFDCPAQVTDLGPTVSVLDLHHPLCDGQSLFGRGHHRPQPHLLDLVLIHLSLEITEFLLRITCKVSFLL